MRDKPASSNNNGRPARRRRRPPEAAVEVIRGREEMRRMRRQVTGASLKMLLLLLLVVLANNSDSAWASGSPHPGADTPKGARPAWANLIIILTHPIIQVCQVNSGESVAIVEIEESRGSDMSQTTRPLELPISGAVDQLELRIESETHKYFRIQDKRLRLIRPLDRDAGPRQVSCKDRAEDRRVIVPVLVKVLDLNDNAPSFSAATYTAQVDELAPVGSVVFEQLQAIDLDSANNGLIEYSILGAQSQAQAPPRLVQRAPTSTEEPATSTSTTTTQTPSTIVVVSSTPGVVTSLFGVAEATTASEPSINLNNEPIINGPMEETEEESDEALLASMNATDSTGSGGGGGDDDNDSPDLPLMLQVRPTLAHRWRRSAVLFRRRMFADESPPPTTLRPKAGLWTNLMSQPDALDSSAGSATNPPLAPLLAPAEDDAWLQSQLASEFFALELAPNTNRPIIRLKKKLDYETKRVHQLVIVATDRASNKSERLSSSVSLVVRVLDGDDQGPAFILDQTGCATGSLPTQTTASSMAAATSSNTERPPLVKRSAAVTVEGETAAAANLPKGFKVTEENFDFSDVGSSNDELKSASPPVATSAATASDLASTLAYSCLPIAATNSGPNGQAVVEYFATVMSGDSDYLLRIAPQAIKARDRDELNAPIRYSFINGTFSNYSAHFQINPHDATIKQVAPLDRKQVTRLQIWLQAQEQSANRLASVAKLNIEVVPSDKNPPVLVPNSYSGFVEENSPLGSQILIEQQPTAANSKNFMRISVIDADYGQNLATTGNQHLYEFETTSEAFKVNREGFVYVNRWPLDRDPPHQAVHMFQVTARQVGLVSSKSLSGPISINVTLLDLNDNAPVIANSSQQPLQMQAGGSPGSVRLVTQIHTIDPDEGDNAKCQFSIHHVSNNGRDRFKINPNTGELEALGRFQSGEQFSLTLQVNDNLDRSSQAILELSVVPGANTGGPQFVQADGQAVDGSSGRVGYVLEVNEGLAPQTPVLQLRAVDPENDPITYSIVDGNVNEDFHLNAKTGVLSVAKRLDREEVSGYNLLVQARDSFGLASSRPVQITIADNNDQNPTFVSRNYTFSVEEGEQAVGRILGRVVAVDGDAGENGQVSYYLESLHHGSPAFSIDHKSGDLKLVEPLDYELTKVHNLVVTARDHGETPRSSSQSVQVRVLDRQDEAPHFERYYQELRVLENLASHTAIGQVQARDLDSVAQISYVLRRGDPELFSVDPQTGVVSTNFRALDYEEANRHILLIGTLENELEKEAMDRLSEKLADSQQIIPKSPLCRLDILVQDLNDNAPQFVNQPLPVRIQDTAQLGQQVTRVEAHDADGSEPNNQVRYELLLASQQAPLSTPLDQLVGVTSDRCAQSFMVDPSSGEVSVRWDLRRDSQSECQLVIKARDLAPSNSLSSLTQVTVYIDHLAEPSASTMIGFADGSFTVELEENLAPNSLVKIVPIVNKPKWSFPMSCEIVAGNELGKFYVMDNEQRDCELRTSREPQRSQLDYEIRQRYTLTLRLNTVGSSSSRLVAQVQVNLLDMNDNRPQFQQVARYGHLLDKGRFLAAVASDAPSETQVFQLRATDLDSAPNNGLVSYELLNEQELEGRFRLDPVDGVIRTSRPVEELLAWSASPAKLPLRLRVLARDNPEVAANSLESEVAEVVVNLIEDRHRIALVLRDSPTLRVLDSKEELLGSIQERTGLIAGLERVEALKVQRNGSLEADVTGTDLWFYLIEPGSLRIVASDDVRIRAGLFAERSRQSLFDRIQQTLGGPSSVKPRLRVPYSLGGPLSSSGSRTAPANQPLGSGLIWFGLSIAITSAIVLIYQCGFWSSSAGARRLQQDKYRLGAASTHFYGTCPKSGGPMLVGGPYAGAGHSAFSTLQPASHQQRQTQLGNSSQFSKEYETQMLRMSVLFEDSHSLVEEQKAPEVNLEVRRG